MAVLVDHTDYKLKRHTDISATGRVLDDYIKVSGEKEPWRKYKKQIPEGLIKRTRIANLDIEDVNEKVSLNFIGQFDRILPLALKPSKISKLLGSMSGRNAVDSALKETNAQIRNIKQDITSAQEELENKKVEIENIQATIPDDDLCCDELLAEHQRLSKVILKSKKLKQINAESAAVKEELADLRASLEVIDSTAIVEEISSLGSIIEITNRIPEIPDLEPSELLAAGEGVEDIEALYSAYLQVVDQAKRIEVVEQYLLDVDHNLHEKRDELEEAQYDLYLFLQEHEICPFTLEPLPEACAKKLSLGGSATIRGAENDEG